MPRYPVRHRTRRLATVAQALPDAAEWYPLQVRLWKAFQANDTDHPREDAKDKCDPMVPDLDKTMEHVRIGPGEHYVTRRPDELLVTVLGSCVAACIRDPLARVGGMNHFMLPESSTGKWGGTSANMRYGNFAMEQLINDILRHGGQRRRLEIKLFGGAAMTVGGASVGHQNATFVETYLREESMPIAASHLRGRHARRVLYEPLSGRVMMLEMPHQTEPVVSLERQFLKKIRSEEDAGSVELFD